MRPTLILGLSCLLPIALPVGCADKRPYIPGYSEGVVHQEKGNYDEAVSCYNKYLQENPKGPLRETVLCQIGKCYEATGNADQAVAYYQKVIDTSTEGIWADLPKQGLSRLKEER